jgi:5'-3' exonuclease
MGIKNLKKFIREKFPNEIQKSNLCNFYGQVFMMDIMSYIYKFKVSMREKWLQSIITMIKLFKINNIHVNIVFEGEAPIEKNKEREQRRKQRKQQEQKLNDIKNDLEQYYQTGNITFLLKEICSKIEVSDTDKINRLLHFNNKNLNENVDNNTILTDKKIERIQNYIDKKENQLVIVTEEDANKIKDICDVFGVPYYQSENEAETMCCKMSKNINYDKKPLGVISEDSDVLAYGSNMLLCDLNISNGDCNIIYLPSLLKIMKFDYQQFINFCVLSGTDYNTNIPGIGSIKCYELIKKYNNIKTIFENEDKLIQKKITDAIQKKIKNNEKKEKNKDENNFDDEVPVPSLPGGPNGDWAERSDSGRILDEENEELDINITPDKLLKNMIRSIEMFDLTIYKYDKYKDVQVRPNNYYWNPNINLEKIMEYCLRYNLDVNTIEKIWLNKIKLI